MDTVKVTANNADQWDYTCDPGLLFLDPFSRSLGHDGLPSMVISYKLNSIDKWPASDKHAIWIYRQILLFTESERSTLSSNMRFKKGVFVMN